MLVVSLLAVALCGQQAGQSGADQADLGKLDAVRITSGEFRSERFGPARWLDGSHFATLEPKVGGGPLELVRYEAVSGRREVLVTAAMLWVPSEGRALSIEDYSFSPDQQWLMVFTDSARVWRQNTRGEFYLVPLDGSNAPRRLGGKLPKSTLQFAKFSPNSRRVAYVSQNDLYSEDVASGKQSRVTEDGSKTVINGTFDWVYEEEFDCRDGFRWSPDSERLAYWQLDCKGVGEFYMIDNLSDRYAQIVPLQYPKAGTQNSACRIGVTSASGGKTVWMQTPGDARETYLPRMEWHPLGEELMVQWLPRQQNHLVIYGCDASTGQVRLVHEERDAAYVDVREDFRWSDDGERFFWTSDVAFQGDSRKAWRQAGTIVWDTRGKNLMVTVMPMTRGYDVMAVDHVDLSKGQLLVSHCDGNATEKALFMDGSGWLDADGQPIGLKRVSPADQRGFHEYEISADGTLAIHTFSAFDQPPVIDLVRLPSHQRVRVLVDNQSLRDRYAQVEKGDNEFFQVLTDDGHRLDGWVMYPKDFTKDGKWPVVFHVYGEPWSQTVKNTWSLGHHLFHRWLTQQGYVVMSIDARGTPAPKGRDWRKALYQNIGIVSSHDWGQAVRKLLGEHEWMDAQRLAIWGWSGGGAMTLNMLFRHPALFRAGMAVAPVTDISLYDTIYQERYCGDPREVPDVYKNCSPVFFAKNLQAKLLLVHGTGDDNVHLQNSERLFDELVKQGKLFEYLAYPNRSHSIHEGQGTRAHLYGSLRDFLRRRVPVGVLR
jgi:dipeptidyl-peptidase 4